ncbi:hypothetical protein BKA70DRAFT_1494058 [Coprinopsis sp. MPI-PUGE-AT-0042]|nr:hypothetical protein BKA70DRAFT_1494058 [Coprinopsis sp. MPI-PUGE-AT-0042]
MFTSTLVLSPSVRNVTLVTDDPWPEEALNDTLAIEDIPYQGWTALVNHVADIGPQLASLKVQLEEVAEHGRFTVGVSTLLDAFPHFSSLSTLDITPPLCPRQRSRLSGELDTLQTLRLPSLQSISIESNSLEICSQFFQNLDATSLNGLTLGCLLEGDISVAAFFEALHTSKRYARLEHIRVHELYTGEGPRWRFTTLRPRFIIGDRTARSLCPFKSLKTLYICPCDPLGIEDSDLEQMLASLPLLQSLELDDHGLHENYDSPLLTLAGVHEALQYTPLLEHLTLAFDGSGFPSRMRWQPSRISHTKL